MSECRGIINGRRPALDNYLTQGPIESIVTREGTTPADAAFYQPSTCNSRHVQVSRKSDLSSVLVRELPRPIVLLERGVMRRLPSFGNVTVTEMPGIVYGVGGMTSDRMLPYYDVAPPGKLCFAPLTAQTIETYYRAAFYNMYWCTSLPMREFVVIDQRAADIRESGRRIAAARAKGAVAFGSCSLQAPPCAPGPPACASSVASARTATSVPNKWHYLRAQCFTAVAEFVYGRVEPEYGECISSSTLGTASYDDGPRRVRTVIGTSGHAIGFLYNRPLRQVLVDFLYNMLSGVNLSAETREFPAVPERIPYTELTEQSAMYLGLRVFVVTRDVTIRAQIVGPEVYNVGGHSVTLIPSMDSSLTPPRAAALRRALAAAAPATDRVVPGRIYYDAPPEGFVAGWHTPLDVAAAILVAALIWNHYSDDYRRWLVRVASRLTAIMRKVTVAYDLRRPDI